jgi:hypothetical protein
VKTATISLNSISHLILVMAKYGVLFEVRTEFLNTINTSSASKVFNQIKSFTKLSYIEDPLRLTLGHCDVYN